MTPTQQCTESGGPTAGDSGEELPDVQRTSMGEGAGMLDLEGGRGKACTG